MTERHGGAPKPAALWPGLLGALALTAIALLAMAPPASAGAVTDVRVTKGIVYGQGAVKEPAPANVDLLLDLYEPLPRTNERRAAVVLIHGGGFRSGSRGQSQLVSIAQGLAERGTVVVSIDYRLSPQEPVPSARVAPAAAAVPLEVPLFNGIVAAIDDTLTALDWLGERAGELQVDPDRLGLAGGSAGAITSDHVAYTLDDLGVEAPRFRFVGDLWGGILMASPSFEAAANQLERGEAALFAVHGTADTTVPVVLSDWLVARARAVGVPVEYHRVEGAGHGFGKTEFFTREVAPGQTAFDRMLDFADTALDTSVDGSATAKKTQRQRGKTIVVKAKVRAGQELDAKGKGQITVKKKSHKLKPKTVDVAAGEKKTLKLKPKKRKDAKKIAKALKKGKKARAKLTVKLTDSAGDKVSEKLSVQLKR